MKKSHYTPLEVEIFEYCIEEGFAASTMPLMHQGPGPNAPGNEPPLHPDGPYTGIGPTSGGNSGGNLGGGTGPDGPGWDWDV